MKLFNRIDSTGPLYDGFSPLECCNVELQYHAIAEVSTALDNPELVKPFSAGGKLL